MKTETKKAEHKIQKNWRKLGKAGRKENFKKILISAFKPDIMNSQNRNQNLKRKRKIIRIRITSKLKI